MQNKLMKNAAFREIKLSAVYSLIMIFISYIASYAVAFALMLPVLFLPTLDSVIFTKIADMLAYSAQLAMPVVFYVFLRSIRLRELFFPGIKAYPIQARERITPLSILSYFVMAFSLSQIMTILSSLVTSLLSYLGSLISEDFILDNAAFDIPAPSSIPEFILDFIAVAILPAILEELFFRGVLLGEFLKYGKTFAICISAFFFASVHGSIDQMMYSFIYGIFFGYIAVKTGSITAGIIIHFLNNAYSCIVDYLGNMYDTDLFWGIIALINLILMSVGLAVLIYKIVRNKFVYSEIPDEQKEPYELREREKYRVFVSPLMFLYYAFIVAETLFIYISYNRMT